MPKFLLITIFILVVAGQVFKVEEYSSASLPAGKVEIKNTEQMVVENKINDDGNEVEIIRWPLVNGNENEEKLPVPVDGGTECLYFDGEIPRLDTCQIEP
jgi:hypothetical protein